MKRHFSKFYARVIECSKHRHAPSYLGLLSFLESAVWPIPPDIMLVPMCLAKPKKAFWYSSITTFTSVAGGVAGYYIGALSFALIEPWILYFGYAPAFERAVEWFNVWGLWTVLAAGFTPIPYKLFTISSGMVGIPLIPFIAVSFIGRGIRFYLVGILTAWGGERFEQYYAKRVSRMTS